MHLHFTQSLEPLQGAGLGSSALGLHQGFLQNGHPSHLYTTRDSGYEESWEGVSQFVRSGPTKAYYAPEMRAAAREQIKKAGILHGHGFYVYPNFLFGGLARKCGKPLVYHIQGFLDPWILQRSQLKKRLVHFLFESANFNHVTWWRAVSEKEHQQAIDYGIKAPIEVLPNGVHMPADRGEQDIIKLLQRFPKQRPKRVLFLSRVHSKKGLDILFHAWAGLDSVLTKDWEIAVFGPDEGGHLAELQSLLAALKLETPVQFYGSVSGDAKEAAFRSADLFVLPSRSEGFPMAVLEAASYGLPVVQTDECNFSQLTQAGGAWEARPEVAEYRVSLNQALQADDHERRQRGQLGQALVKNDYQWSAIAAEVETLCRKYC